MIAWFARHPLLLGISVGFAAAFLAAFPLPIMLIAALALLFWCVSTLHHNVTVTKAALRQRCDYENRLVMNGDMRGIYGTWRQR